MNSRRNNLDPQQIDEIEGRLAGTLKPVSPPKDFVLRLSGHIHFPERSVIVVRLHDWRRLMFVIGGVLSGAVVILTVARALFHIFGRRNVG